MSLRSESVITHSNQPRHGHVFGPMSRAAYAVSEGKIPGNKHNGLEAGKFFPNTESGLSDEFAKDDVFNGVPPIDGKIASAGHDDSSYLDLPGTHWKKHSVYSNETLNVSWAFTANHATRRWNYFITKSEWSPDQILSRGSFEEKPFYTVQNALQPFWDHSSALKPHTPTTHQVPLPYREGYHVLLAVWEVADTPNAFYQVIDLNFIVGEHPTLPPTPQNLSVDKISSNSVELSWDAVTGYLDLVMYTIKRNGLTEINVDPVLTHYKDEAVEPETEYTYTVSAVGILDVISEPSHAVSAFTLAEGGDLSPPTPPRSLHVMNVTASSVHMMWGHSSGTEVKNYIIYRDGIVIDSVEGVVDHFVDYQLSSNTAYSYVVIAEGVNNSISAPSNSLSVTTKSEDGGEGSTYPAWKLNTSYIKGDIVSHVGKNWRCDQTHVSYDPSWEPGGLANLWTELHA